MSDLPTPTVSATITGAITNRVKVRKRPAKLRVKRPPVADGEYQRGGPRRGQPLTDVLTITACISMRPEELDTIDAAASALGLSRSRYLVLAARAYAAADRK